MNDNKNILPKEKNPPHKEISKKFEKLPIDKNDLNPQNISRNEKPECL
jgi:hypothetical protein